MKISSDQQGFTLLEVLVALTIFALGLLGIAGIQIRAIEFNAGANVRSAGTAVAQRVMEDILARDPSNSLFDATDLDIPCFFDPDTSEIWLQVPGLDIPVTATTAFPVAGAGTYTAIVDIEANTPVANVARVNVTVTAPNGRSTNLTSLRGTF